MSKDTEQTDTSCPCLCAGWRWSLHTFPQARQGPLEEDEGSRGVLKPEQDVTMMGGWLEEKPSMPFQQCSVLFTGDKCCSLV